jgi:hypothetical protein
MIGSIVDGQSSGLGNDLSQRCLYAFTRFLCDLASCGEERDVCRLEDDFNTLPGLQCEVVPSFVCFCVSFVDA